MLRPRSGGSPVPARTQGVCRPGCPARWPRRASSRRRQRRGALPGYRGPPSPRRACRLTVVPPPRPGSRPYRRPGAPAQGPSRRCTRQRSPLPQLAAISPPSRTSAWAVPTMVGCPAQRWVHRRIRFPGTLFNRLFERPNASRSCHRPGAKMGSHSAKSRQESGGVWTVICPGKQHFANLLDSSRPARGLIHTEEVTGSIPVSPTDVRPGQRLHEQLSSYSADGSCRRIGSNLGDRALHLVACVT
jgi:hypothetical protein